MKHRTGQGLPVSNKVLKIWLATWMQKVSVKMVAIVNLVEQICRGSSLVCNRSCY